MKKSAIVTGANKGIGFETALQLTQLGYTVWVGARDRDRDRGENAVDAVSSADDFRFVSLDATDDAGFSSAAARIEAILVRSTRSSTPPGSPSRMVKAAPARLRSAAC